MRAALSRSCRVCCRDEACHVGTRAGFYDSAGAARDVLQNHLLQLLALTAMEEPTSFDAEAIRTEKLKVLRAVTLPTEPAQQAIRGQYTQGWVAGARVPGYLEEKDVPPDSTTETYVAVRLGVQNRRWAGVPFYLRAGKRLPKRVTEIAIQFKTPPIAFFRKTGMAQQEPNTLILRIQPEEGISLRFLSKQFTF